jgi:hypothetical protein
MMTVNFLHRLCWDEDYLRRAGLDDHSAHSLRQTMLEVVRVAQEPGHPHDRERRLRVAADKLGKFELILLVEALLSPPTS